MAVSSGCLTAPDMAHFATLDRTVCFPQWVSRGDAFVKHVPDWSCAAYWTQYPNVRVWPYEDRVDPCFDESRPIASGGLRKSNVDDVWHNSLLFALQLAPRLGFSRIEFVGVDLLGGLAVVSDYLRTWHPLARAAGIEWVNLSPISTLCEWMPSLEGSAV